ncbi:hypothetical protein [Chryseobacterium cheonjiense]|uniref:Uncharacterized protein n=1 Tax=Chryseobacterium cheonjiense TaxID=2728845 RepID=A0A7Y0A4G9_9FLAO|nr:hypothetical protein [Chryseobacterium cheonjiense]NML56538.1 hypothetical protein [Chryseobacterium cheonjiense]
MKKNMTVKFKLIIITMFIDLGINAQIYKPTKGEVVFISKAKIADRKLFDKTFKKYKKVFIEATRRTDKIRNGNNPDHKIVKQQEDLYKKLFTSSFIEKTMLFIEDSAIYTHKYTDSVIWYNKRKLSNNKITSREKINIKSNILFNLSQNDSTRIIEKYTYSYSPIKITKILEKRNIRKNINNFECFKVIYEFKVIEAKSYFAENIVYRREAWVTDKIKSVFHPVVDEQEIIKKYYPLEVKETIKGVKGFERTYILNKLTLL